MEPSVARQSKIKFAAASHGSDSAARPQPDEPPPRD